MFCWTINEDARRTRCLEGTVADQKTWYPFQASGTHYRFGPDCQIPSRRGNESGSMAVGSAAEAYSA
jgi:hypothetical protein